MDSFNALFLLAHSSLSLDQPLTKSTPQLSHGQMRLSSFTLLLFAIFTLAVQAASNTNTASKKPADPTPTFETLVNGLTAKVGDGTKPAPEINLHLLKQLIALNNPQGSNSYLMSAGIILLIADLIFLLLGVGVIMVFSY